MKPLTDASGLPWHGRIDRRSSNGIACVAAFLLLVGCGGPGMRVGRIGEPVPLPSGPPENRCEVEGWHELAPTRVIGEGVTAGFGYQTQYSQVWEGHGVYRPGDEEPLELPPLLPAMKEPDLMRVHMAPIEEVEDAEAATLGWSLGSLGVLGLGIGVAAGIQGSSPTGAAVAGVGGVVLGLTALVIALAEQPSGAEQVEADAKRQLFATPKEDWQAVQRGVDRLNLRQRLQCGGGAKATAEPTP